MDSISRDLQPNTADKAEILSTTYQYAQVEILRSIIHLYYIY